MSRLFDLSARDCRAAGAGLVRQMKPLDASPMYRDSESGGAISQNGTNENFRIKTLRRKPQ
jgi:hypothetical protein